MTLLLDVMFIFFKGVPLSLQCGRTTSCLNIFATFTNIFSDDGSSLSCDSSHSLHLSLPYTSSLSRLLFPSPKPSLMLLDLVSLEAVFTMLAPTLSLAGIINYLKRTVSLGSPFLRRLSPVSITTSVFVVRLFICAFFVRGFHLRVRCPL